jgi:XTP/dITP diphosphohydrolase
MRLYIATSNPGKLRDFAHAAKAFPHVEILPLPGLNQIPAPEETADTFLGNATLKALAYSTLLPDEIVLADDSGIVVPALGGQPGVRSARYADDLAFPGSGSTDQRNLDCLLAQTAHLHRTEAHYTAVIAAARQGQIVATARGQVHGTLLNAPCGTSGFGYDPIFYLPELDLTMAEIDMDTRLKISHRGRALASLLSTLPSSHAVTAQSQR